MKTIAIVFALALAASTPDSFAQDNGAPPSPDGGHGQGRGGLHLLPPHAQAQLNLTADQQKQLADLEEEVKGKIASILTPEQLEQLKQMRPPQHQGGPNGGGGGKPSPTPPSQ